MQAVAFQKNSTCQNYRLAHCGVLLCLPAGILANQRMEASSKWLLLPSALGLQCTTHSKLLSVDPKAVPMCQLTRKGGKPSWAKRAEFFFKLLSLVKAFCTINNDIHLWIISPLFIHCFNTDSMDKNDYILLSTYFIE